MADNYLEYHREEYEMKKAKWLAKKRHSKLLKYKMSILRPEDEAL